MAKIILLTGAMVTYSYVVEYFMAWYSANPYEWFTYVNRTFGPYAWACWIMLGCNVLVPQVFWFKKARVSVPVLFVASILINVGMWFERFVIIVTSLHRDFLPSSWSYYRPTFWDVSTFLGSFGLFFTLFLLFVRFVPQVAIAEVKGALPGSQPRNQPLAPASQATPRPQPQSTQEQSQRAAASGLLEQQAHG
jgi:molybdopterin-containing oxidoreductase family membrane subunit